MGKGRSGDSGSDSSRKICTGWLLPHPIAPRCHRTRAHFQNAPPGGVRFKHIRTPGGDAGSAFFVPKTPRGAGRNRAASPRLLKVKMEAEALGSKTRILNTRHQPRLQQVLKLLYERKSFRGGLSTPRRARKGRALSPHCLGPDTFGGSHWRPSHAKDPQDLPDLGSPKQPGGGFLSGTHPSGIG